MKSFIKNLKFAYQYAKDEKLKILIIVLINFIRIIVNVIAPIVSAKIIVALTSNEYNRIIILAIAILLINSIGDFLYYVSRRIAIKTYRNTLSKIEIDLGRNVLKLENSCLDQNGSGVFIQRLTNDTSKIADAFQYLLGLTTDLIKYIGVLIAIFIINKTMFIYIIIIYTLLYILENIRTKKKNAVDKEVRKASEKATGFINELVRGARDIKMLNSENDFINELSNRINEAHSKKMTMQKVNWNYKLITWELTSLFEFIIIIILVIYMKQNIIIPTTALIIYNYYSNLGGLIYFLGDFLEYLKDFNLSTERVYAILKNDEFKKEKFGSKHLDKVHGDFEFKNVNFSYNNNKKVLKDLSFKINANETVAFVGKSGAGKSTIFSLLCKMYHINSGKITIDGINIDELDKESIRGNITIISQNPYIFNMSIKDNLKIVKKDLTDKEMKEACKAACLEEFIKELPDGYDTIVGEGGVTLSGGQKQRLAIARALVQKTEIILFDEATSALDNETQEQIQKAIENMKNEYTILIIAHRLSTILNSDRILYLDNGKIIAEGTHQELLKNNTQYKNLYKSEITEDK